MGHAGLGHSDATVLWTQVAVLLALAWLLAAVARRLGQPPIVGSLVAGLLAGPSVFGHIWPTGFHWFHPTTAVNAGALGAVAGLALLVLLIVLGAETDLPLIRDLGKSAVAVVTGSLVLPLLAGAAVAVALPAAFGATSGHRTGFILLVAAAMAVSSLPVIARITAEMGITRRNVGQLSIATATANDVVGFVLLAVATALVARGGSSSLLVAVVGLVALVVLLVTVGNRVVDFALRKSRRDGPDVVSGLAVCIVFTFAVSAAAQALGIDAALGAFLAGMVLGRSRFLARRVLQVVEWMSAAIFAPLYFATAGLSVDIGRLASSSTVWWFVVLTLVAVASKLVGVLVGGRLARLPTRESFALGFALNGRGALQVILATAGLSAGILNATTYTAIILLSLVSSIAVPPALRLMLRNWAGTHEEQHRLAHEEEMTTNVVVRGQRLLVPSRGSDNSVAAARVLDLAWPAESQVTLLRVGDADVEAIENVRESLGEREVHEEVASRRDVVEAILAEANLGYGAIGVGAADRPAGHRLLPDFIEELLNRSPIPLVVVRRGDEPVVNGRPVIRPRRILVPVTGNAASRAGQEVAQLISRNTGADMSVLHVVTRPVEAPSSSRRSDRARASATAVLEDARQRAETKQLDADIIVRDAAFSGEEIDREAQRMGADLVVAGTTVRRINGQPFLGHTVEHLLEHVCGPTVVVVVLPDAQQAVADEHIDRATG